MVFFSQDNDLSNNNGGDDDRFGKSKLPTINQERKLPSEIKVKYLEQIHKCSDPEVLDSPDFRKIKDEVAKIQLRIIDEIVKRGNCLIFTRDVADNDVNNILRSNEASEIGDAFKNFKGFLANDQKNMLWKYGAIKVAYFQNIIKEENIKPVITRKQFKEEIYDPIIKYGKEIKEKLFIYGVEDEKFIKDLEIPKEPLPTKSPNSVNEVFSQEEIKRNYFNLSIRLLDFKDKLPQNLDPQLREELNLIIKQVHYLINERREEILRENILDEALKPENKGKNIIIIFGKSHRENIEKMFKDNLWE